METLPRIINNLRRVPAPTGFESWMIVKKTNLEIIGDAGFKGLNYTAQNADIGYGIIAAERRKGHAAEAVSALLHWAFSTGAVKEITAKCLSANESSVKLLQKLGFLELEQEPDKTYRYFIK